MIRLRRKGNEDVPAFTASPLYEVRFRRHGPSDAEIEVWQLPSPATPRLTEAVRVAGLRGRNLELVEHRILRRLTSVGVSYETVADGHTPPGRRIDEQTALHLGLIFRVLAPMRDRDRIRDVVEGVEAMGREEAAYWLGMAMHRKNPRRVLTALRYLLTAPKK